VAFIALAMAVAVVAQAANLFSQNLLFTRAQTEVSFWGRGDYRPDEETIRRTSELLNDLLVSEPAHPDYLGLQANATVWLAYWSAHDDREQYAQRAINIQYAALLPRPAHRHSWVKLAEYLSRTGARSEGSEQRAQLAAMAQTKLSALLAGTPR